jgi:hypothetical protein
MVIIALNRVNMCTADATATDPGLLQHTQQHAGDTVVATCCGVHHAGTWNSSAQRIYKGCDLNVFSGSAVARGVVVCMVSHYSCA